jgi:alpha-beta hydrolase superfamily lysophospholipase
MCKKMGRENKRNSIQIPNHPTIKDINQYLEFYGIHTEGISHNYEFLQYGEEKIFIQSFAPSKPIGMVLVVHGYLDHSGSMRNLINELLNKSYQVITYDLQGHGLSSGSRAEINNFNDYVKVFHEVNNWARRKTTLPVHVVAHSTGGAIVMDYLVRSQANFQKVILVSPLIRSHQWRLSKLGIMLIKPFVKQLTRVFKRNSSNFTYLKFVKQDPLQHHKIPLVWFEALMAWNKKLTDYKKCHEEVLVIQGDRDRTVDWKYNMNFIQKQFPNCQVRLIHGGDHQLLNENPRLLEETLAYIREGLKE